MGCIFKQQTNIFSNDVSTFLLIYENNSLKLKWIDLLWKTSFSDRQDRQDTHNRHDGHDRHVKHDRHDRHDKHDRHDRQDRNLNYKVDY